MSPLKANPADRLKRRNLTPAVIGDARHQRRDDADQCRCNPSAARLNGDAGCDRQYRQVDKINRVGGIAKRHQVSVHGKHWRGQPLAPHSPSKGDPGDKFAAARQRRDQQQKAPPHHRPVGKKCAHQNVERDLVLQRPSDIERGRAGKERDGAQPRPLALAKGDCGENRVRARQGQGYGQIRDIDARGALDEKTLKEVVASVDAVIGPEDDEPRQDKEEIDAVRAEFRVARPRERILRQRGCRKRGVINNYRRRRNGATGLQAVEAAGCRGAKHLLNLYFAILFVEWKTA